jgi:hypothetical protein
MRILVTGEAGFIGSHSGGPEGACDPSTGTAPVMVG